MLRRSISVEGQPDTSSDPAALIILQELPAEEQTEASAAVRRRRTSVVRANSCRRLCDAMALAPQEADEERRLVHEGLADLDAGRVVSNDDMATFWDRHRASGSSMPSAPGRTSTTSAPASCRTVRPAPSVSRI